MMSGCGIASQNRCGRTENYEGIVLNHIRRGSHRLILTRVETIEHGICIITQIVYAIVTFKLIIYSFSSAYIAHISAPIGFKY